jgi:hypothetical protein
MHGDDMHEKEKINYLDKHVNLGGKVRASHGDEVFFSSPTFLIMDTTLSYHLL